MCVSSIRTKSPNTEALLCGHGAQWGLALCVSVLSSTFTAELYNPDLKGTMCPCLYVYVGTGVKGVMGSAPRMSLYICTHIWRIVLVWVTTSI